MKTFTHHILIRRFGVLMLTLTFLISLAVIYAPTSYAATHAQIGTHNTSPRVKPNLNGWNSYEEPYIDSISGRTVTFEVDWGNASAVQEVTYIYYGDGSSDTYYCDFNCSSGSTTFTHTYPRDGTNYFASVQLWWNYPALGGNPPVEQATGGMWVLTN